MACISIGGRFSPEDKAGIAFLIWKSLLPKEKKQVIQSLEKELGELRGKSSHDLYCVNLRNAITKLKRNPSSILYYSRPEGAIREDDPFSFIGLSITDKLPARRRQYFCKKYDF
ncbi:MAG: hypothetical protein AABX11_05955 [Nanoarchaeota archaeon]